MMNKKGVSEHPCLLPIWGERSGRAPSIKLFINMLAAGFVGDIMKEMSFYQSWLEFYSLNGFFKLFFFIQWYDWFSASYMVEYTDFEIKNPKFSCKPQSNVVS